MTSRPRRSFASIAAADLRAVQTLMSGTTDRAIVVSAPPGGGKTTLVRALARSLTRPAGVVVPVIAQTNNQVDDLIIGLHRDRPRLKIGRLYAPGRLSPAVATLAKNSGDRLHVSTDVDELLAAKVKIIVATTAKWVHSPLSKDVEWAILDEAFQMRSDGLYVAGLAHRLLCVGDPGQLDPFTTLSTDRWQGLPHSPTRPAMATLTANNPGLPTYAMAVSHRLPPSAATIISAAFYPETPFTASTASAHRSLSLGPPPRAAQHHRPDLNAVLDLAAATGWGYAELPARHTRRDDPDIARTLAALVRDLFQRHPTVTSELPQETHERLLDVQDIAVIVSHISQENAVKAALSDAGVPAGVTVSTANRIQGREYTATFIWHPLTGRRDSSPFHTDPGRLAVMLTRHRHAVTVVGRAGIDHCLLNTADSDDLHIGEPEPRLDPIEANWAILDHLMQHRAA
jgi:hypothetical protein